MALSPTADEGPETGRRGRACWVLLLPPLLAFLLYLPRGTWFQGDDFLALTYVQDWDNVLHDFTGPQYRLTGHTLFWRPLITLSFAVEARLFGSHPFWFHLDNALCHGLNTLLLLLVLRRVLDRAWAFRAAMLWGLHPVAAFSVMWTVGRVDVHVTFWILLAILFTLRRAEGRGGLLPSLLAAVAALATKELALILPPLACLALLGRRGEESWGRRIRKSLLRSAPLFALVPLYLLLRLQLLGEMHGGYKAAGSAPGEVVKGLFLWAGRLWTPLATGMGERVLGAWALPFAWVGGTLLLLLLLAALRRTAEGPRTKAVALGALWFVGTCVPLYPFLAGHDCDLHIRIFYLPLAGLMVVAAGGGRTAVIMALVLMVPAHMTVRTDFAGAYRYNRKVHQEILSHREVLDPGRPLVVTDREPDPGWSFRLLIFLERMLLPPFAEGAPPVLRWRPINKFDPIRVSPGESGFPLPQLLQLRPDGGGRLQALPGARVPRFDLRAGWRGALDYGRLGQVAQAGEEDFTLDPEPPAPGEHPYRVMVLTNQYYLACRTTSLPDGALSLKRILLAKVTTDGRGLPLFTYLGLSLDLAPRDHQFAWILAARLDPNTGDPITVTRELLPVPFEDSAVRFFLGMPAGR